MQIIPVRSSKIQVKVIFECRNRRGLSVEQRVRAQGRQTLSDYRETQLRHTHPTTNQIIRFLSASSVSKWICPSNFYSGLMINTHYAMVYHSLFFQSNLSLTVYDETTHYFPPFDFIKWSPFPYCILCKSRNVKQIMFCFHTPKPKITFSNEAAVQLIICLIY